MKKMLDPTWFAPSLFAVFIVVGTAVLSVPACRTASVSLMDLLFTTVSAVCVTGLSTIDVSTALTPAGQIALGVIIQAGGMGIVTVAGVAMLSGGGKLDFKSESDLGTTFVRPDGVSIGRWLAVIAVSMPAMELAGAVLLTAISDMGFGEALFTSVSALCNAGFTLRPDSLASLAGNPAAMTVVCLLVACGGIGFFALFMGAMATKGKKLPWAAKVILSCYAAFFVAGTVMAAVGGGGWLSAFWSVTARTAGFSAGPVGVLPPAVLVALCLLMFAGGAPGGCAGGVKVTTVAAALARVAGRVRGLEDTRLMGRTIPDRDVASAMTVLAAGVGTVALATFLLCAAEGCRPFEALFEVVSAFSTTGLSMELTPTLGPWGKILVMTTMFVGRLGPLVLVSSLAGSRRKRTTRPVSGSLPIG